MQVQRQPDAAAISRMAFRQVDARIVGREREIVLRGIADYLKAHIAIAPQLASHPINFAYSNTVNGRVYVNRPGLRPD